MAKTIKFNLICDEHPVRTIEDLQNNFSIEDVLEYYNNKLLHRWLNVRGYSKEYEQVCAISSIEPMDIIKQLIHIFDVDTNEKSVEENIYILQYLNERKELCSIYKDQNYNVQNIISDYQKGYYNRYIEILENPDDVALIKANISEIASNYLWLFTISDVYLFNDLVKKDSWVAIMCLLMKEETRNRFLPIAKTGEDGKIYWDTEKNVNKRNMFEAICQKIKQRDFIENLGEHIISVSGVADDYWRELEPKGKKCMIIRMDSGDRIRSVGCSTEGLSSVDVYNEFLIVDGIEYKCNTSTHKLLYMEV